MNIEKEKLRQRLVILDAEFLSMPLIQDVIEEYINQYNVDEWIINYMQSIGERRRFYGIRR